MLSCKKRILAVIIMILGLGDDIHGIDPFQQSIKPVGIIQRIDLGFGALRRGIEADDLYAVDKLCLIDKLRSEYSRADKSDPQLPLSLTAGRVSPSLAFEK